MSVQWSGASTVNNDKSATLLSTSPRQVMGQPQPRERTEQIRPGYLAGVACVAVAAGGSAGAAAASNPALFSFVGIATKFFTSAPSAAFQMRTSTSQLPVAIHFAS